jgi:hypothetical protein
MLKIKYGIILLLGLSMQTQASVERYVAAIEKVNTQAQLEMRDFFRSLDPQLQGFSAEQKSNYCSILQKQVKGLYQAADKYRNVLDKQYKNITKVDVIQGVQKKHSILAQKYQLQCELH